jgi:hypothetical protein
MRAPLSGVSCQHHRQLMSRRRGAVHCNPSYLEVPGYGPTCVQALDMDAFAILRYVTNILDDYVVVQVAHQCWQLKNEHTN